MTGKELLQRSVGSLVEGIFASGGHHHPRVSEAVLFVHPVWKAFSASRTLSSTPSHIPSGAKVSGAQNAIWRNSRNLVFLMLKMPGCQNLGIFISRVPAIVEDQQLLYAGCMALSKTEATARALLQHYLPKERFIYNLRPVWLRNPKTGRRLELDIYCPDRGFAIEVDGIQHGRFIKGMHRNFGKFTDQQERDMHKIEVCRERGITLYKLTIFDLTIHRFPIFIDRLCKTYGMPINRYAGYPYHIFKQSETLSRAKFKVRPYRKPGLFPLIRRLFTGQY